MFLQGSLNLVPVSLLANPLLETLRTEKTTATSSPAGCPGNEQPRDSIDGGSKAMYANQDRGVKIWPNFSLKKKKTARTRFRVRPKT